MPDPRLPLEGRQAIVTGASRGIGAAIAAALATAGANVLAISRSGGKDEERVRHLSVDVASADGPQAVRRAIEASADHLDILVNAAAVSLPPAGDASGEVERMRLTLEVDLIAPYRLVLALLPALRRSNAASIINVTSINSKLGFPGNPGYVAAKSGLAGLTRALAVDLGRERIRVNSLAPGYVHTAMTDKSFSDPSLNRQRRSHTLLGRWGDPEDLAGAALFLASDASLYVTGQEIFVDGGWTANGLVPADQP